MDFETFLKDLCLIELSDLVYAEPDAAIPTEYPSAALRLKLLPVINSALRQMHIDHQIAQMELVLRTDANITQYFLTVEHAESNAALVEKYIIDSVGNPYIGDLARIDEVLDENGRLVYSAHENFMGGFVRIPRWDCLTFSTPLDQKEYLVRYRASAPVMVENQTDASVSLSLPPGYVDLLRLKVAERVYGAQKTQESVLKASQYRGEAKELEARLSGQDTAQEGGIDLDGRLYQKGFA
jgi:hypothetical protein